MSADAPPPAPRKRRRWGRIALWSLLGVLVAIGLLSSMLRWAASGGLGASVLASRLNGTALGAAGELRLRGFAGDLLDDLHADRIELIDDDGPWLTLLDVTLDWQPRALFNRTVEIQDLNAAEIIVRRTPRISEPRPPREEGGDGGLPVSIVLDSLGVGALTLGEELIGREETFAVEASAALRQSGSGALHLQAIEAESRADTLTVDGQLAPGGAVNLEVQARSEAGGLIAELIGAPQGSPAALDVAADGTAEGGDGRFTLRFAADEAASGDVQWDTQTVTLDAQVAADRWPMLNELTARAGAAADIDLTVENYRGEAPQIALSVASDRLDVQANGALPTGERLRTEGLTVDARIADLGVWTGDALQADSVQFSGQATRGDDGFVLDGTLAAEAVDAFTITADALSGPATVQIGGGEVAFDADLDGAGAGGQNAVVGRLVGAAPALTLSGAYGFEDGALALDELLVEAGETRIDAEGNIALRGQRAMRLAGAARNAPLQAVLPNYQGDITGDFAVTRSGAGAPMQVTAEGTVSDIGGAPPQFADVIGDALDFDLAAQNSNGVFTIRRGVLEGPRLRAGVEGDVSDATGYALDFEAAMQGPLPVGPAEIAGEAMARGGVTGPLAAPQIEAQVFAETLNLAGRQFDRPVLDVQLTAGEGLSGQARFTADSAFGPAEGTLSFGRADGALTAPDLSLDWADITASGGMTSRADGLLEGSVHLSKAGAESSPWPGMFEGDLELSVRGGEQYVQMTAQGEGVAFPERDIWIDHLNLEASGPLDRLDFAVAADGVLRGVPVDLASQGVFSASETGRRAEFDLDVMAGRVQIASAAPLALDLGPGGERSLRARLSVDEGGLEVEYDDGPDGALVVIRIEDAPVAVVEAARPDPRLDGVLNADMRLDTREGGMTGSVNATLTDARSVDAEQENIDMDLRGTITNGALQATLNMRDEGGLSARATGALPLARSDGFLPVRIAMDQPLSGQLDADGPIDTVSGLLLGAEQRLSGQVRLAASLSGTPGDPRIEGEGGLDEARFDDAVSGLVLDDLLLALDFSNDRVRVTELSANDGDGGALSGSGQAQSSGGEWSGEVEAAVQSFRVVNRADAQAQVSGELAALVSPDRRAVEGALTIEQGEFAPPQAAPAGVRTIEVVEINVPGAEEDERVTGERGPPIELDIDLSAPRRLFVRSNNLDVELSVDAHIGGTVREVEVTGEANVVRGDADLAGRRFVFDSGRAVFDGDPLEADLNFTATRETSDLTAIINVTGTPREPRITLESRPPLPQDEILAQVLFGRSATDLSALEAAQLASALASMTGGGGFDALGSLRSGLGLDRLAVGQSSSGDPTVSGGRYLTDDVYLELSTGTRGEAAAQVEWQALNDFAIISRFGSTNQTSISVRWRKSY